MIGTRNKSKNEKQQMYKKDLSNIYFTKMEWHEVKIESNEGKKSTNPPKRWGHTFSVINGRIFMIGGCVKSNTKTPINLYELCFERSQKTEEMASWKKHTLAGAENFTSIESHTNEVYQGNIYLFCGHLNFDTSSKILKVDVEKLTIQEVKLQDSPIKKRESHISFSIFEKYVMLHGGINGLREDGTTRKMGEKHLVSIIDIENRRKIEYSDIEQRGVAPCERESHTRITHKSGIFIFGGLSISGRAIEDDETEAQYLANEQKASEGKNTRAARTQNRRKNLVPESVSEDQKSKKIENLEKQEFKDFENGFQIKNEQSTESTVRLKDSNTIDLFGDNNSMVEERIAQRKPSRDPEAGSDEEEENVSDFLNDLFLLKYKKEADKFTLTWEKINLIGSLQRVGSMAGLNIDDEFLIIFGGEGYSPSKKYDDEDAEILDLATCIHIETKSAFQLQIGGSRLEPLQACSSFFYRGKNYIHGGEYHNKTFSNKMFQLDLEQRIKKDLFGEFTGHIKPLCAQCKVEYDHCLTNMESFLKTPKKTISKRVESDKKECMVETINPGFFISFEIKGDIKQIVDMERIQSSYRPSGGSTSNIINQIVIMFYTLRQRLFFNAMNFEILGERSLGVSFEGSFNIFEQLDNLEFSILDSIFYFLIVTSNSCKVDSNLYIKLKTKVLWFFYGGYAPPVENGNQIIHPQIYMNFKDMTIEELPEQVRNIKFKKNLIVFNKCSTKFVKEEANGFKDIVVVGDEKCSNKIQTSFRTFFSLFFKEKIENLKISVLGQAISHIYLNDILMCADRNEPMNIMNQFSSIRGISFVMKTDQIMRNPIISDFGGNKVSLHYGPEYLIFASMEPKNPNDHPEYENTCSMVILLENILRPSI